MTVTSGNVPDSPAIESARSADAPQRRPERAGAPAAPAPPADRPVAAESGRRDQAGPPTPGAAPAPASASASAGPGHVAASAVPADRRRGGQLRVLLGPRTVGSTSGFMGVATLLPGEKIAEHYHPYSEEFLYVSRGAVTVDCDGEPVVVAVDEGLFIPVGMRHRLRNTGAEPASVVFHLSPLAPRPDLGHVDTENTGNPVDPGNAAVPR
jgi:putative monooxygenase